MTLRDIVSMVNSQAYIVPLGSFREGAPCE